MNFSISSSISTKDFSNQHFTILGRISMPVCMETVLSCLFWPFRAILVKIKQNRFFLLL